MFDSVFTTSSVTVTQFFTMAGAALVSGVVYAWIMSFRVRSTKRFFLVNAVLPFVIATVITFVAGNIGAGVTSAARSPSSASVRRRARPTSSPRSSSPCAAAWPSAWAISATARSS